MQPGNEADICDFVGKFADFVETNAPAGFRAKLNLRAPKEGTFLTAKISKNTISRKGRQGLKGI
jgi:hypothetical protein